jgi:hypothetical protein
MADWKGCGRKRSWPNLRYYPGICPEGLRKRMKNLSHYSRSAGRDLNMVRTEYEAGVLTTQQRRLVLYVVDNVGVNNQFAGSVASLFLRKVGTS